MGDRWANLMRGSYGLGQSTGPETPWMQPLGHGALAMMKQAEIPFAGQQDPQTQDVLKSAFGKASEQGANAGGSTWNLGSNPYEAARELGKPPLQQLQRNQQFATSLMKQWQPPDLRLTGEDLLNVKMGQMSQNAQAQQQAFQAALQGSSAASAAQSQASAASIAAIGKLGSSAISSVFSPSLSSSGYYQPSLFQSWTGSGGGMPETSESFSSGDMGGGTSSFGS
jgi:hypothetical protein